MNPRVRISVLLSLGAIASVSAAEPSVEAARLVTEMQLDQSILMGFQASTRNAAKAGNVDQKQLECTERMSPAVFTDLISQGVSDLLTPTEIEAAQTFYATSGGKKVIQLGFVELRNKAGVESSGSPPSLSQPELDALQRYSATSSAQKLAHLFESPSVKAAAGLKIRAAIEACKT